MVIEGRLFWLLPAGVGALTLIFRVYFAALFYALFGWLIKKIVGPSEEHVMAYFYWLAVFVGTFMLVLGLWGLIFGGDPSR